MKKSFNSPQNLSLRAWVWLPLALLALWLGYGLLSTPSHLDSDPTFHVASRYVDRGMDETGWSNETLAVLTDYRGFELTLLSFFATVTAFAFLLLSVVEDIPLSAWDKAWAWLSLFCTLILFLLGWDALSGGHNWQDYEFFNFFAGPPARTKGSEAIAVLTLLSVFSACVFDLRFIFRERKKDRGSR